MREFGAVGTGGAPVPPGLPAAVFEARMRENAREGQKANNAVFSQTALFFYFVLFSFVNRCAIDSCRFA